MPLLCNAFHILVYLINVEDFITLQKIVRVFQSGMAKDHMSVVNNLEVRMFVI
jgi:hypothetical protein